MKEIQVQVLAETDYPIQELVQSYFADGEADLAREIYYSPDFTQCLELTQVNEIRFGPGVYKARTRELKDKEPGSVMKEFKGSFYSPGAYGYNRDHWSGSPWAPDSKCLALFESLGNESAALRLFFPQKRDWLTVVQDQNISHHMWSQDGRFYLFRNTVSWFLFDVERQKVMPLYTGSQFPKHCYFDSSATSVLMLTETMELIVFKLPTLEVVAKRKIGDLITPNGIVNFSIPFRNEGGILLGMNVKFGRAIKGEKWLKVKWSI